MSDGLTAADGLRPNLPKFLVLDATALENKEQVTELRELIKLDRIEFVFPHGLADVPVLEECRALCDLENFEVMYDLTMQYLADREIIINIFNNDGSKTELGAMHVQNKFTDLRSMQCVADFPYLVNWLTEFMAGYLSKKFPLPSSAPASSAATGKKKAGRQKRSS